MFFGYGPAVCNSVEWPIYIGGGGDYDMPVQIIASK